MKYACAIVLVVFMAIAAVASEASETFSPTFLWLNKGIFKPTKMVEISVSNGKVMTREDVNPWKAGLQLGNGKIMIIADGKQPAVMKMNVIDVRN